MKIKLWPYKLGSAGAGELAEALGCLRVKSNGKYRPKLGHMVINWGNSEQPNWYLPLPYDNVKTLNQPSAVRVATNKLLCLEKLDASGVNVPAFCSDIETAKVMFAGGARRVYCRTKLRGHSGEGIVVAINADELVPAPLYTEGVFGLRDEYRVHVVNGKVIDYAMKKRRAGGGVDLIVRNHTNGWVYCRDGVLLSEACSKAAIDAVAACHLDFGAVDILVLRNNPQEPIVLEINTAPGLEGATVANYANAFKELL